MSQKDFKFAQNVESRHETQLLISINIFQGHKEYFLNTERKMNFTH